MSLPSNPESERDRSIPTEYIFEHALTQEVSYESLLLARRRDLHRRAAEAIEELFQDQLDEQAAALGQHYAKAEVPEKAMGYFTRAGDRAAKSYANQEAIAFYRQAIEQVELALAKKASGALSSQVAELDERAGDLLELIGRHDEARDSYAKAIALERELRSEEEQSVKTSQARLHRKIAKTYETERNFPQAFQYYDQAEAALADTSRFTPPDWEELIETRLERIWVYYFLNDVEEMNRRVPELHSLVESRGNSRQRANFVHRVIHMRLRQERYEVSDETLAVAHQALRLRQENGDVLLLGHTHFILGLIHVCRLELPQAEEQLHESLKIARRTGDIVMLSRCLTYLVQVERRRQDVTAARTEAQRLLSLVSREKMKEYVAMARATLAWIAWRQGDNALVIKEGEAALDLWSTGFVYPFKWNALWPLIAAATAEKNTAAVVKYSKQLLEPSQQKLTAPLAGHLEEIIALNQSGRDGESLQIASRAVQLARELKYL